jgi:hypothetical protein
MMDVQSALRDQVAERPVREQLEVDDRRDGAKQDECDQKREQRADRHASAEIEARVVVSDTHTVRALVKLLLNFHDRNAGRKPDQTERLALQLKHLSSDAILLRTSA